MLFSHLLFYPGFNKMFDQEIWVKFLKEKGCLTSLGCYEFIHKEVKNEFYSAKNSIICNNMCTGHYVRTQNYSRNHLISTVVIFQN